MNSSPPCSAQGNVTSTGRGGGISKEETCALVRGLLIWGAGVEGLSDHGFFNLGFF